MTGFLDLPEPCDTIGKILDTDSEEKFCETLFFFLTGNAQNRPLWIAVLNVIYANACENSPWVKPTPDNLKIIYNNKRIIEKELKKSEVISRGESKKSSTLSPSGLLKAYGRIKKGIKEKLSEIDWKLYDYRIEIIPSNANSELALRIISAKLPQDRFKAGRVLFCQETMGELSEHWENIDSRTTNPPLPLISSAVGRKGDRQTKSVGVEEVGKKSLADHLNLGSRLKSDVCFLLAKTRLKSWIRENKNELDYLDELGMSLINKYRLSLKPTQAVIHNEVMSMATDLGASLHVAPFHEMNIISVIRGSDSCYDIYCNMDLSQDQMSFSVLQNLAHILLNNELSMSPLEEGIPTEFAETLLIEEYKAEYLASAIMMPRERFLTAAQKYHYDPEELSNHFSTPYDMTAKRLVRLAPFPLFYLKIDSEGEILEHYSEHDFPFQGGLICHNAAPMKAFDSENTTCQQMIIMADSEEEFFCIARAFEEQRAENGFANFPYSITIGCFISDTKYFGETIAPAPQKIWPDCTIDCKDKETCPLFKKRLRNDMEKYGQNKKIR